MAAIEAAASLDDIERIRVAALGRNGVVTQWMKSLGTLPKDERAAAGARFNQLRAGIEQRLAAAAKQFEAAALEARLATERIDITLPVKAEIAGRHPSDQPDHCAKWWRFSARWDSASPKARISRTISTISPRSTFRPSIRHGKNTTPSISPKFRAGARRKLSAHPYVAGASPLHAQRQSRRSGSSCRAAPSAATMMRRIRRCSTRSKAC